MITYILIGTLFVFLIDLVTDHLQMKRIPQKRLNNWERLFCIATWPLGLLIFLRGFILTILKNNKDE